MSASITVSLSDQDLKTLRKVSKAQHRRWADFVQLVFAEGLQFFFCEEHVMIKRDDHEIPEDELKQIVLNEKLINDPELNMDQMKEQGFIQGFSRFVSNEYGGDNDKLIKPIVDRLTDSACD